MAKPRGAKPTRSMLFAAGGLGGAALVLAAYFGWFAPEESPGRLAVQTLPIPAPEPQPVALAPTAVQPVASSCPAQAIVPVRGAADGRFVLEKVVADSSHTDPQPFLAVAREAAQQGRVRDAEVALLAACRVAEKGAGAQSAPVADVKTEIGEHYVRLAVSERGEAERDTLLRHAAAVLSDTAAVYAAALGKNASKTRMAEQRLAALNDPRQLQQLAMRAAPRVVATAPRGQESLDTRSLGAARSSSLRDRPPLPTEDLSQVDRDLDRLYAQARAVSRDPAGMQQRHAQALAQRNACGGDANCLRQWYAQRKSQLFSEF